MPDQNQTLNEAVNQLAAITGEPTWFTNIRHNALTVAQSLELPTWDRTNPANYPWHYTPATWQSDTAPTIDGTPNSYNIELSKAAKAAGVVVCDLFEAFRSHADVVMKYLGSIVNFNEDKFSALHYALINRGLLLFVPKNVQVNEPVILRRSLTANDRITSVHTLIVVETGAQVQLVEDVGADDTDTGLVLHTVEVAVHDGASVHYTGVQNMGNNSYHLATRRAVLGRDAQIEWVMATFGSRLSKDSTETLLKGDGCQARNLMLFMADIKQHLDVGVVMDHQGQHTSSDILGKGLADDQAWGIYRAMTHIARGARFTSAYQKENTLLLSKQARADAIPGLTIDEDEVQAGHAATVGQADEDQLFYLMSRGLTRVEAIRLVALGFLDPIVQRIPTDHMRERLLQLVDRKMSR